MLFIVVLALITGIFTGIKASGDISISNCNDKSLVALFEDDISIFNFFVKRLFWYVCIICLLFVLCRFKAIIPLSLIFLAYYAFSLGLNSVVISLVFGLGGALSSIIIIVPIQLCVLSCFCVGVIFAIKDCLIIGTYGRLIGTCNPFIKWVIIIIVLLFLCIIESLIINLTRSTFIFII